MRKVSPVLFFVLLFCLILCSASVSIAASPNQPQTSLNESMNLLDGLQKRVDSRVDEKLQSEYAKLEIGHKNVDRWLTYMWTAMAILFTVIGILAAYQIFNFIQKTKEAEKHLIAIKSAKDRVNKISEDAHTQKSEMEKNVLEPILQRLFVNAGSYVNLTNDEMKQLREIAQKPFSSVEIALTISALLSAHNSKYDDSLGYFHQLYTLYPDSERYAWFYATTLNNLGAYSKAKSVLESALEVTKSDCDGYVQLNLLLTETLRKMGRIAPASELARDIYEYCDGNCKTEKNMYTCSA